MGGLSCHRHAARNPVDRAHRTQPKLHLWKKSTKKQIYRFCANVGNWVVTKAQT